MNKQTLDKKALDKIALKVQSNLPLNKKELNDLVDFSFQEPKIDIWEIIKRASFVLSIMLGGFIVMYPDVVERIATNSPSIFLLPDRIAVGLDYAWSILGSPTEQRHIIYHIPNIVLYSFGILGVRSLIKSIIKKSWRERIEDAQSILKNRIENGTTKFDLPKGHSVLFIGGGDYIGESLARTKSLDSIIIADKKQPYTNLWNKYEFGSGIENLKNVLELSGSHDAGEFIFFPVTDNHLFLPGENDYDLAPYRLDTLIKNLKDILNKKKWSSKKIFIIADKYQHNSFETQDNKSNKPLAVETLSFFEIAKRDKNIFIMDPSDIVIQKIIEIAKGAQILFRASKEGVETYKDRFYTRLKEHGYKVTKPKNKLIIGYDIYEQQIEQQSITHRSAEYLPVILSQDIYDALIHHGYKKENMIFIPEIVRNHIHKEAVKDTEKKKTRKKTK